MTMPQPHQLGERLAHDPAPLGWCLIRLRPARQGEEFIRLPQAHVDLTLCFAHRATRLTAPGAARAGLDIDVALAIVDEATDAAHDCVFLAAQPNDAVKAASVPSPLGDGTPQIERSA